ncbi:22619_t:CDS:2, partial [Gigaspora margarita]
EVVALYCMNKLEEHKLQSGASFLMCDCGGGTVDLTSRNVLNDGTLGEITERTGGLCGSTFVDKQFRIFLEQKLGKIWIGELSEFRSIDLDIEKICPALMDLEDWLIEIGYEDVISIFDPVVDNIIKLIRNQLNMSKQKSFSSEIPIISVPQNPITAVLHGAVIYGLNKKVIATRILTTNYDQKSIVFKVFATSHPNQRFCDEPGMKEIRKLTIELPDLHLKLDRSVEFGLKFGRLLITATARNKKTANVYSTTFQYTKSESYFEPAVN